MSAALVSPPLYQVLEAPAPADSGLPLPAEELKLLYRAMLRVRVIDGRMLNLQRQGRIGFYGLATGEEAAVIGSGHAFAARDWIFPALRQGGVALLRGYPLDLFVAQCVGNSGDLLKGRQMPCHYSDRRINFVSWSSVIATQLPHAVGAAMAAKLRKDDVVCAAYLGDGATSAGDFHTAMNFAGVWRAPVVFICQNNQFAISVPIERQTASAGIAVKAQAYGFEGVRVDGNDVLAVSFATRDAVARARAGAGPTLIEAVTYRRGGHSSSDDPARYRDERVSEEWARRDPLLRYQRWLAPRGLWDAALEESIAEEAKTQLDEAIRKVEAMAPVERATLVEDVYAEVPRQLKEQGDGI
ncbi:MAG: 3-methyl-2-oxobutanoate dehydrogenase [Planctomycetes bacterium]|nr:3-methyl-2-oxobutanoate dehydrogenase [Planctomycetota bacterium]